MIVMDSLFASMIAILLFLCGIGPPPVSISDFHSNPGEQMKPWRAGRLQLFRNILTIYFYSSNQARYNRAVFFSLFCYAGKGCPSSRPTVSLVFFLCSMVSVWKYGGLGNCNDFKVVWQTFHSFTETRSNCMTFFYLFGSVGKWQQWKHWPGEFIHLLIVFISQTEDQDVYCCFILCTPWEDWLVL